MLSIGDIPPIHNEAGNYVALIGVRVISDIHVSLTIFWEVHPHLIIYHFPGQTEFSIGLYSSIKELFSKYFKPAVSNQFFMGFIKCIQICRISSNIKKILVHERHHISGT